MLCLITSLTLTSVVSTRGVYHRDDTAFDWNALTPSTSLKWVHCYDNYYCSRLSVPLRYSDLSGKQAAVALIMLPSSLSPNDKDYKGPVLFNPGGPGGSGVDFVLGKGADISEGVIGRQFDLIGFDPRGVGNTTPPISFFEDSVEAGMFDVQQVRDYNESETSIGRAYVQIMNLNKLVLGRAEKKYVAETVTTSTVARDMLSIMKATGQEKLQYLGYSYGTVLGATFAAMFPEKVGRIVLDGVVDSWGYYKGIFGGFSKGIPNAFDRLFPGNDTSQLLDADKCFTSILDACVQAGPKLCPLYEKNTDLIRARVNRILDKLRIEPVSVFSGTTSDSGIVDSATVRRRIFHALYSPYNEGAGLVAALAALEQGNGSAIYQGSLQDSNQKLSEGKEPPQTKGTYVSGSEAIQAISCGDIVTDDPGTVDDLREAYREAKAISPLFAGVAADPCPGWSIRGDDRFKGSFNQNTSHPILFVGNIADPITPLASAFLMSEGFKGSVVLTQNSSGHTSGAANSTCTGKILRAYFADGTLPEEGTVWDVIFADTLLEAAFEQVASEAV
ncbi:alpha/beta-hydrolase [Fomitiporia mediterranea MF3/22]|uniref:alpha/beta-hydrolase n=1 Tax=Fomitiporia mediterranea (strain MF3/22) TaxID=694068 RepID=UPI000440909B|nr:alpha/beta-hydrolase [Fomitiporia mediterranea MF3/22]EJD00017.1 alpha/beta-hydrolase [Fomitiporia mediterranea MF3/22]